MRIVVVNSGEPIYRQIEQQVARAVLAGELRDGDPLPSIRQLARDLRVSVITTTRAYTELEQHGFITTVPGKGCFARKPDPAQAHDQLRGEVNGHLREAVAAARLAGMSAADLVGMLERVLREDDHG
ncbi:MAG TPA: GntR family transcriptional regulator [Candidatus Limnocylindrales bacterium]|nr:GntR family transcriptional regulator [Candidatus Limnocylindrales bacterium]